MKRILFVSLVLIACNPVKKVLNDPKKFAEVKEAVIRSGACVNDTITIQTVKDSIVYRDSIIEINVIVPCKDFDTVLADGTKIKVSSGVLTYKHNCPQKETTKTITKTNNIRDKAYEDILKSDVAKRDSTIQAYTLLYDKSQLSLKEAKLEAIKLKWKMFLVVAAALIWTFRYTILKLVKPL